MRRRDRQVTDRSGVLAIIESADSCRLGMIDDSGPVPLPYIVALNYGFELTPDGSLNGRFWFHCAREGRKLDLLRRNPQVCVQLDCDHQPVTGAFGCSWGMKYASVVAMGRATIVEDPAERQHGLDCLMGHYQRLWRTSQDAVPRYEEKPLALTAVIRVDVESLTAKRKA
jgi:uncharacterized protein